MRKGWRSPLKEKPLRNPGQSLDEKIHHLQDVETNSYLLIALSALVMAFYEWFRWYTDVGYHPIALTIFALLVCVYCGRKVRQVVYRGRRLKQGRDGEKIVGQYLDGFKSIGYRVFHDIVCDGFNIDHVITCEHGVFTVETKTYSKPGSGRPEILVKGDKITVNGFTTNKIVYQAKGEAAWLKQMLLETTGENYPVRPVVLFPEWYVNSSQASLDLWVLNPKALPTFISNTPKLLSQQQVMQLTYSVSRYIKTC
ncbi:nuclease-related domain-containing protein [uncultured Endozoicomonas sp.]|uniref:nuclease-related domain-containing protein n=1 Tax=uncultured Endozoicomonas sp. TaxID=432652 RepID=UPI002602662F|nr:nuclease-related domain-containing protein [uncultured Endozoicomonas sp.]